MNDKEPQLTASSSKFVHTVDMYAEQRKQAKRELLAELIHRFEAQSKILNRFGTGDIMTILKEAEDNL